MPQGEPDWLSWCLAILVGSAATIEFLIGKSGRKRIVKFLEEVWLNLQYINIAQLGRREAEFTLSVAILVFGSKTLSWQRATASVVIPLIISFPILVLDFVIAGNFPSFLSVLTLLFFSIPYVFYAGLITIYLLKLSIFIFNRKKYATVYMGIFLLMSHIIISVGTPLFMSIFFCTIMIPAILVAISFQVGSFFEYIDTVMRLSIDLFGLAKDFVFLSYSKSLPKFLDIFFLMPFAVSEINKSLENGPMVEYHMYIIFIISVISSLRVIMSVYYLSVWNFCVLLNKPISFIFYRFSEYDNSALTTIAASVAAIVKIGQYILTRVI